MDGPVKPDHDSRGRDMDGPVKPDHDSRGRGMGGPFNPDHDTVGLDPQTAFVILGLKFPICHPRA
ncbi:MAG: hypothetical protein RL559_316 [Pseudomonadota bacterium]|jgi:hypothetical protein